MFEGSCHRFCVPTVEIPGSATVPSAYQVDAFPDVSDFDDVINPAPAKTPAGSNVNSRLNPFQKITWTLLLLLLI
jgi:hypothetical protein